MANSKKKTYEALAFIVDGDRTVGTGEPIELTDLQAERLLEAEVIKEVEVEEEAPKKKEK